MNPMGKEVKITDFKDNMDITKLKFSLQENGFYRLNEYLQAYEYLTGK